MTRTRNHGSGLECCGYYEWKDLTYEIVGDQWWWRCPGCNLILRIDSYHPPTDVPA